MRCLFFFILSGYFFYHKIECFDAGYYLRKIKSRIKTLFVPYLIWNCVPILFIILGNLYSMIFRNKSANDLIGFMSELWSDGLWHVWWDKINGMPFDSPLWYVRDLMVLCILSPVIYWIIRRMNYWYIGLLSLLFIVGVNFPIGFSITGLLFLVLVRYLLLTNLNGKY